MNRQSKEFTTPEQVVEQKNEPHTPSKKNKNETSYCCEEPMRTFIDNYKDQYISSSKHIRRRLKF
jgi:hypothetical protein